MKRGHLSQYFKAVAYKNLSAVEADTEHSNQHEFNGVKSLVELLGEAGKEKRSFPTALVYLDDEGGLASENLNFTWYDARAGSPDRSEHRLYFPASGLAGNFSEGDLLVIGKRHDDSLVAIVAHDDTAAESQLRWLFGLDDTASRSFAIKDERGLDTLKTGLALNTFLEELGFAIEPASDDGLDEMISTFGSVFPSTRVFSEFARSRVTNVSPIEDPDGTLISWMEREEELFRTFERHQLKDLVEKGFRDVDSFINVSLSVQNKRKSRAGFALQNHLGMIFGACGISHSRDARTEGRKTPDFIFPSIENYRDVSFPQERLTMLGAKTTCKDRWRQVLSEAGRIDHKHLITLEAAISVNQTNEMQSEKLQLVVPKLIHDSYTVKQREWLMDLGGFIKLIIGRQQ